MNNIEIGKRIHHARALKNYTLDEVAKKIGVAKSTIQRYENGKIAKIKLPVIDSIANALCVNPAWLVGKSDEMKINISFKSSETILQYYNILNDLGKQEAIKRVQELTYIPQYNNYIENTTNNKISEMTLSPYDDIPDKPEKVFPDEEFDDTSKMQVNNSLRKIQI